jgi:hypothetical protein
MGREAQEAREKKRKRKDESAKNLMRGFYQS